MVGEKKGMRQEDERMVVNGRASQGRVDEENSLAGKYEGGMKGSGRG